MREVINLKFPADHPNQMPSNWHPGSIYTCPTKSNGSISLSIQWLYTGNAVLLENSPYDKIWRTGKSDNEFDLLIKKISLNSKQSMKAILANEYPIPIHTRITEQGNRSFGLNLLGRILMEQRAKLRQTYINESSSGLSNHTNENLHLLCGTYQKPLAGTQPGRRRTYPSI